MKNPQLGEQKILNLVNKNRKICCIYQIFSIFAPEITL